MLSQKLFIVNKHLGFYMDKYGMHIVKAKGRYLMQCALQFKHEDALFDRVCCHVILLLLFSILTSLLEQHIHQLFL